eukprot:2551613-Pyramimonas_sp.AAC.1
MRRAIDIVGELLELPDPARKLTIPSKSALRRARRRLDATMILWWRARLDHCTFGGSLQADISEQSHWNYMCQRFDFVEYDASMPQDEVARQEPVSSICTSFTRSSLPAVTLGHGQANVAHKLHAAVVFAKLMSGSQEKCEMGGRSLRR